MSLPVKKKAIFRKRYDIIPEFYIFEYIFLGTNPTVPHMTGYDIVEIMMTSLPVFD